MYLLYDICLKAIRYPQQQLYISQNRGIRRRSVRAPKDQARVLNQTLKWPSAETRVVAVSRQHVTNTIIKNSALCRDYL